MIQGRESILQTTFMQRNGGLEEVRTFKINMNLHSGTLAACPNPACAGIHLYFQDWKIPESPVLESPKRLYRRVIGKKPAVELRPRQAVKDLRRKRDLTMFPLPNAKKFRATIDTYGPAKDAGSPGLSPEEEEERPVITRSEVRCGVCTKDVELVSSTMRELVTMERCHECYSQDLTLDGSAEPSDMRGDDEGFPTAFFVRDRSGDFEEE